MGKSKDRIEADREAAKIKAAHIIRNEKIKADRASRDALVKQEKKARKLLEKYKKKGYPIKEVLPDYKVKEVKEKLTLPTAVGGEAAETEEKSPEEKERQALIEKQRESLPDNLPADELALLSPEEKPYLTDKERKELSPASQQWVEKREQGAPKEGHVDLPQAVSWKNVAEIMAQVEKETYEKLSPEVQRFVNTAKAFQEGKVTLEDLQALGSATPEIHPAITSEDVALLTEAIEGGEGFRELMREREERNNLPGIQWDKGTTPEAKEAYEKEVEKMEADAIPIEKYGLELPEDIRQIVLEEKRQAGLVKNGRVYLGDHKEVSDERYKHNYWQRIKVMEDMDAYIKEEMDPDDSEHDEEFDAQLVEYNEMSEKFNKWMKRFEGANKSRRQSGIIGRKNLINQIRAIVNTSVTDTVHKGNLLGFVVRLQALEG